MKRCKCQCGCGRDSKSLINVYFVPQYLRNLAYVPHEDVQRLAVAKACADRMIALNGSWCGLV